MPIRFRSALVVACVFSLAACRSTALTSEANTAPLRVVSANLRLNVDSDGENAWPNRRDAVARALDEADLFGVQEALPDMLADLDARLPEMARIGTGREADGGGEASSIFYRTDRFDLLDSGTFWLSETPEVAGSRSWDAALPRIATWGRFRDRRTGAMFVYLNTHFDHIGETARQQSAQLIAERLPALSDGGAAIVTGDLNSTPESAAYATFAAAGLRDARLISETPASGPNRTWNDFGRAEDERRIDYVLLNGPVTVLALRTLDETIGDVMGTDDPHELSDHYFVVATVVVEPR